MQAGHGTFRKLLRHLARLKMPEQSQCSRDLSGMRLNSYAVLDVAVEFLPAKTVANQIHSEFPPARSPKAAVWNLLQLLKPFETYFNCVSVCTEVLHGVVERLRCQLEDLERQWRQSSTVNCTVNDVKSMETIELRDTLTSTQILDSSEWVLCKS